MHSLETKTRQADDVEVSFANCWDLLHLGSLASVLMGHTTSFFHSANSTGQYSDDALKVIAKLQIATIDKLMGYDNEDVDDEDEIILVMKAIKTVNPKISTYFYMNSHKDCPEMTRMNIQTILYVMKMESK